MTHPFDDRVYSLEPVFRDDFRTTANWRCEGVGAQLWTENGWLYCDTRGGDVHAATIWCAAAECPDPLWLEFDVRFLDGLFNGNLILHARGTDGRDVLESSSQRKGNYDEYHIFPNYILTFLNDEKNVRVRYRRNPGFSLIGETFHKPVLELDRTYHAVVILRAGRIQFWVDGVKRYEGSDGSPLTGGRLALRRGGPGSAGRTWRSTASLTDRHGVSLLAPTLSRLQPVSPPA